MDHRRPVPLSRHGLFWTLAAVGLAADLASKHYLFSQKSLLAGDVWWLWPGHAGFQLSLNEGALFGMGQGNVWIFAACSLAAAVAIPLWLFVWGAARDLPLTIALGCIFGGVLGNLYDRTGLAGLDWGAFDRSRRGEPVYAVRDFVLLVWRWDDDWRNRIVWPNFNIADALLVCGAIAIFLLSLRKSSEGSAPAGNLPTEIKSS